MKQSFRFRLSSKERKSETIKINPELPYLAFKNITLISKDLNDHLTDDILDNLQFTIIRRNQSGVEDRHPLHHEEFVDEGVNTKEFHDLAELLAKKEVPINNESSFDEVVLEVFNENSGLVQLNFEITFQDLFIDLQTPIQDFYSHITQDDNVKILFSAPL